MNKLNNPKTSAVRIKMTCVIIVKESKTITTVNMNGILPLSSKAVNARISIFGPLPQTSF